jgi:hypothetical protein
MFSQSQLSYALLKFNMSRISKHSPIYDKPCPIIFYKTGFMLDIKHFLSLSYNKHKAVQFLFFVHTSRYCRRNVLWHGHLLVCIIIIITGMTALCEPWPSPGFLNNLIFAVWGCKPHIQPPTWRTRVSLFIWLLPLDLPGLGGPTSSYATAGIALRVLGALKPHHHNKVRIASVGVGMHQPWNKQPYSDRY